MSRHVTVELDVVIEKDLDETLKDMVSPPSYVDPDTDRTSCHVAEEVWFEGSGFYGCDACARATRVCIEYEVVLSTGPTGWPLVAFHGPVTAVELMLKTRGYEDGLDTYAVEYEEAVEA